MDPDNSIGASGIAIPSWMKQKIGDRYDLDDSAFSPPSQDDNFFFIRYPKTTSRPQSQTNYHRIDKYLEAQQQAESMSSTAAFAAATSSALAAQSGQPKILASQMSSPMNLEFDPEEPPPNLSHRRGSKSLPASPLSSPKSSRKANMSLQNRYFTAAFSNPKQEQTSAGYSGWIMSSLLGPREHELAPISESPGTGGIVMPAAGPSGDVAGGSQLAVPQAQGMRKVKSAVQLRDESDGKEEDKVRATPLLVEAKKIQAYKPKPSELRELNFWSPTSM